MKEIIEMVYSNLIERIDMYGFSCVIQEGGIK
jgi:hypothetical protein